MTGPSQSVGPHALAGSLQQRLRDAVERHLAGARRVVLLDHPSHMNIGDAAIYLGELVLLRSMGLDLVHVSDQRGYVRDHVARHLGPDGAVLLHGGGNFGDAYPRHQRLRERVVRDFPDHRIVQLPQSLAVKDPSSLKEAARLFARHGGFHVLVREHGTEERFADLFPGVPTELVPDAAHFLGALPRRTPEVDVAFLKRRDWESSGAAHSVGADAVFDWPSPTRPWHYARLASRAASMAADKAPRVTTGLSGLSWRGFEPLARERVETGTGLVSRGRVLVTDRLHGHILALMAGQPHVLLDNSTGKVASYHETWTSSLRDCELAAGEAEAVALARAMVERL